MFYYLYKITNTINQKIYVGIHETLNLNDGYFGSGRALKQSIKKHGIEYFKKEILEMFESREQMLAREKEIVDQSFVKDQSTYNLNLGGTGSFSYINSLPNQGHQPGQQKQAALAKAEKLKTDPEYRKKFKETMSAVAKKTLKEGKCVWKQPGFINPALSRKWVSNDAFAESKFVTTDSLNEYISNGWYLGRKYNPANLRAKHKKRN